MVSLRILSWFVILAQWRTPHFNVPKMEKHSLQLNEIHMQAKGSTSNSYGVAIHSIQIIVNLSSVCITLVSIHYSCLCIIHKFKPTTTTTTKQQQQQPNNNNNNQTTTTKQQQQQNMNRYPI